MQVRGFHSGGCELSQFESTDIAVCTFERANSLINYCVETEPWLGAMIGILVCDEVRLSNCADPMGVIRSTCWLMSTGAQWLS